MVKKRKAKRHSLRKPAKIVKAEPKAMLEVFYRKKEFGKVPVEKHFVLHDGRKLESLFQLVDELETMGEEVFRHHVNELKNDFANWVRDVFESPPLAEEIQRIKDRIEMQRAVMKHLLREVAHIVSKEHRNKVKKEVQQGKKAARPVKCIIH